MLPDTPHFGSLAREKIINALLSLMAEYPFEEITVLQITQRACVARRTYYMYYKTKLDVLDDYYDVLAREYYSSFENNIIEDNRKKAELFFTFWLSKCSYLQLLKNQNLLPVLMGQLHDYLIRMIDQADIDKESRYYAAFYAGGLWSTLIAWIDSDFMETPAELADLAVRFDYMDIFKQVPI